MHEPNVITCRDGRKLGYAEYGAPDGTPTLAFIGAASRHLRPPDEITRTAGVRLITVERPGFGLSDIQPGRTLLNWPDDVVDLTNALNLSTFAILGASQGGPYAAVCAYKIPERLTKVTLVSSLAPFDAPGVTDGMNPGLRFLPILANRAPWMLSAMQKLTAVLVRRKPQMIIKQLLRSLSEVDRQVFQQMPQLEAAFLQDASEIYRQGSQGITHDIRVVCQSWGFDLCDIQIPIAFWQGEQDMNVPAAMGHYLARRFSVSSINFVSDAGHFLLYSHWQEIIA
ncbi:alpha/beta hydrolase [Chloroflexi bacterium TSY]|nr:alpha/beta hydrolase [Chloroflexi bacterium TSY]